MKYFLILSMSICSSVLWGQSNEVLEIIIEADRISHEQSVGNAALYLESKAQAFNKEDESESFLFSYYLGTYYYQLEEFDKAYPYLEQTVLVCNKQDEEFFVPANRNILASYYLYALASFRARQSEDVVLTKMLKAKEVFEKSQLKNDDIYSSIQTDLELFTANTNTNEGRIKRAIIDVFSQCYQGDIQFLLEVAMNYPKEYDLISKAIFCQNAGFIFREKGMLRESVEIIKIVLKDLETGGHKNAPVYRTLLNDLSTIYTDLNDNQTARKYCEECKYLYESNMDYGLGYVRCLNQCAIISSNLNDNILAKILIDVALAKAEESYYSLNKSNYIGGTEFVDEEMYITILSNAAQFYKRNKFLSEASVTFDKYYDLIKENNVKDATAKYNLAIHYINNNKIQEGMGMLQEAYQDISTQYQNPAIAFNYALYLRLLKDKRCGEVSQKLSYDLKSSTNYTFSFASVKGRSEYWNDIGTYLYGLNSLLYNEEGNNNDIIYNNILFSKGILLRSECEIKNAIFESNDSSLICNYASLLTKRELQSKESDKIQAFLLENEIEEQERILSSNISKLYKINVNWEDIRNQLKEDEIAIEFTDIPECGYSNSIADYTWENRLCALVISKTCEAPQIIKLYQGNQIYQLEKRLYYTSNEIYNLIWKPLETKLKGIKTIYFAPDRELNQIAIEYALIDGKQKMSDKYNMVRLSSTRELVDRKGAANPQSAVLYGGLKYDLDKDELIAESRKTGSKQLMASRAVENEALRYGVSYLKGTKEEVENIERNLKKKGIECVTVSGNAGTEESFRALSGKSVDILHLATHGYFWSEEDAERRNYIPFLNGTGNTGMRAEDKAMLRSGLFFSGANVSLRGEELPDDVEDGVLTAMELSNLNLGKVDLVVLSACQSGLGETSGDGVFGLQRGFKLAGAKTLLMSLWKVDDKATQILMTEFYKNLLAGDTKVESLRKAQKVLQADETYKDPEYWAGWILLDALN